jgi:hypothetical protein
MAHFNRKNPLFVAENERDTKNRFEGVGSGHSNLSFNIDRFENTGQY